MTPVKWRGAKPSPAGAAVCRYYARAFEKLDLFRQLALALTPLRRALSKQAPAYAYCPN